MGTNRPTKKGGLTEVSPPFFSALGAESAVECSLFFFQEFFFEQNVSTGFVLFLSEPLNGQFCGVFTTQLAEQMLQSVLQFGRSAFNGECQFISVVGYQNRLVTFWTSLHFAAFVFWTGLAAILIGDMHDDSSQV